MTYAEYYIRLEAYQLQEASRTQSIALQAWFNSQVKATTGGKHPKPVYRKLEQLYNYQQAIDDIRKQYEPNYVPAAAISKEEERAEIFARRMKEFRELKKQGKIIPLHKQKGVN